MFDISPLELLTIALIALIVFGPQRLPDIARKLGSYIRELRDAASELTAGLDREVRELKEPFTELKEDLTKPVSELKDSLDETARGIQNPLREVGQELRKPVSPGGPATDDETPNEPDAAPGTTAAAESTADSSSDDGVRPARWVADEPEVGVAPSDAWKGLEDPVPPGARDADGSTLGEESVTDRDGLEEQVTEDGEPEEEEEESVGDQLDAGSDSK